MQEVKSWIKPALLVIAIQLMLGEDNAPTDPTDAADQADLWSAVRLIIVADVIMSLDNVVAVAAVAQGSFGYLFLGVALSVPFLVYGSMYISGLLNRHPALINVGGAMLAWTAGDLAVSDPMIADWVDAQAFALRVAAPFAATVFALLHSRILAEQRETASPSGATDFSGWSIARFLDRQLTVDEADPAPAAPPPPLSIKIPAAEEDSPPQEKGSLRSRILIVFGLIVGPVLIFAVLVYWLWLQVVTV